MSVAENNFLNDNHNIMEPNVISLLHDDDEEEEEEDEDTEDEQLAMDMGDRTSDEDAEAAMYEQLISNLQSQGSDEQQVYIKVIVTICIG